ncbi:hypothetical protein ALC62_15587 [Cyphomyrmex costatus]|uniref:THAP-type domain-containing protein n=1 Tax=Cyphomyrmex costatus TaxID=456900 RepID=A0A151I6V7_9HYME|nr:hypothetical protein ALC62_15587 [Cyphomyrmex costatus]
MRKKLNFHIFYINTVFHKIIFSKMTGCSAPDCNDSTKKNYIIKVFPRNPEKRAKWAANGRLKFDAMTISGFC